VYSTRIERLLGVIHYPNTMEIVVYYAFDAHA
jgi:hypothetical protein